MNEATLNPSAYTTKDIVRWATGQDIPAYVKQASIAEIVRPEDLPSTAFADPGRTLPCHTPAAVWCSARALAEGSDSLRGSFKEAAIRQVDQAARFFGIEGDINRMRDGLKKQATVKTATYSGDDFALVRGEGETVRRSLPIKTEYEVKSASAWLEEHRLELPYALRRTAAGRILKQASALGFELDNADFIERQAGLGGFDRLGLAQAIRDRQTLTDGLIDSRPLTKSATETLAKLAEAIETSPAAFLDPDVRADLVSRVEDIDRATGLKYGGVYQPLEETAFFPTPAGCRKIAASHVMTSTGRLYAKADLVKLSHDDLRQTLGDDLTDEICPIVGRKVNLEKLAEQLPILPRPDAEALDHRLSQIGVQPAVTKAANGPTDAEWAALAAAHA